MGWGPWRSGANQPRAPADHSVASATETRTTGESTPKGEDRTWAETDRRSGPAAAISNASIAGPRAPTDATSSPAIGRAVLVARSELSAGKESSTVSAAQAIATGAPSNTKSRRKASQRKNCVREASSAQAT